MVADKSRHYQSGRLPTSSNRWSSILHIPSTGTHKTSTTCRPPSHAALTELETYIYVYMYLAQLVQHVTVVFKSLMDAGHSFHQPLAIDVTRQLYMCNIDGQRLLKWVMRAWNWGTTSTGLGLEGNHQRDSCKVSKSQTHQYTWLRRCVPTGVGRTCPLSWSSAALRRCFWMWDGLSEHPTINQHRGTKTLLAVMMVTKETEAARNPRHFPESALELSKLSMNQNQLRNLRKPPH